MVGTLTTAEPRTARLAFSHTQRTFVLNSEVSNKKRFNLLYDFSKHCILGTDVLTGWET